MERSGIKLEELAPARPSSSRRGRRRPSHPGCGTPCTREIDRMRAGGPGSPARGGQDPADPIARLWARTRRLTGSRARVRSAALPKAAGRRRIIPTPSGPRWHHRSQLRHASPFLMRRNSPSHWPEVNSSTTPDRSRESLASTNESDLATSTHPPSPPLALLLRQISVEYRFGCAAIKDAPFV